MTKLSDDERKIAASGKGTVEWEAAKPGRPGHYKGRISVVDGRPWVHCPPGPRSKQAEFMAREHIARRAEVARANNLTAADFGIVTRNRPAPVTAPAPTGENVEAWFKRFHEAKEAKGLTSVKDMRGRAHKWILPTIAHKVMGAITRADLEGIVHGLDVAVAAFQKDGPGKGRLSPSTAANVWGDLQHALDEAVRAKDPSLRVLTTSPAKEVRGPEGGNEREGQVLYSDELVLLLAGKAVSPGAVDVPLYRRQTYAVAVYTKGRASELEALTAADVDLVHGTVSISKQADRTTKATDTAPARMGTRQTKTKSVRTVDIEPNLRPLLEHLVNEPAGEGGRILHMPPPEDRAELLRKDLRAVGVTREALFIEGDPLRRAIVFHELRDTGLVHMAVRGDSPITIQWAGGHTDFKTTQGYLDRGRVEARRIGLPLPALPAGLYPEPPPEVSRELDTEGEELQVAGFTTQIVTPTGIEPVLPT